MKLSDVFVGKELFVGCPNKAGVYIEPVAIGIGPTRIRGSAYIEGPILTGDPTSFAMPEANLMVGRCQNIEAGGPLIPPSIFKVSSRANVPTPIDVILSLIQIVISLKILRQLIRLLQRARRIC